MLIIRTLCVLALAAIAACNQKPPEAASVGPAAVTAPPPAPSTAPAPSPPPQALPACQSGEKRLNPNDDCLPPDLFAVLLCLKTLGNVVEVKTRTDASNRTTYDVNIDGKASGVVIKGSGGGKFTKEDESRVISEVEAKLDTTVTKECFKLAKPVAASKATPIAFSEPGTVAWNRVKVYRNKKTILHLPEPDCDVGVHLSEVIAPGLLHHGLIPTSAPQGAAIAKAFAPFEYDLSMESQLVQDVLTPRRIHQPEDVALLEEESKKDEIEAVLVFNGSRVGCRASYFIEYRA